MSARKSSANDAAARDAAAPGSVKGNPRGGKGVRWRRIAGLGAAVTVATLLTLTALLPLARDHNGAARIRQPDTLIASVADPPPGHHRAAAHLPQAAVEISSRAHLMNVPRSFFGLSTEYGALPIYERHLSLFEKVLSLLHVRGEGPMILRIGGDSADRSFWDPKRVAMPWWAFGLTGSWVRQTSSIVRREHLKLIIDLNLVTATPSSASRWAQAALAGLPRGSIIAFEVGNEPDLYAHWYWFASIGRSRLTTAILPRSISSPIYDEDYLSYSRLLARVAPTVPLAAPALANPSRNSSWLTSLIDGSHPDLGIVSAHSYPYSSCVKPTYPSFATIPRILSERASAGIAGALRGAISLAHRAGLSFHLTELNSVTCGGRPGVSNTFATALWAPDALFDLLRAGVDGLNVHIRATTINAPFVFNNDGLQVRPLLYGLLLFVRTLGPGAALVPSHLRATPSLHLKVWAVRVRHDILHVLMIDKGNRSISVHLRLPATRPASVERLLAPSVSARFGETLGGQQLSQAATWEGAAVSEIVRRGRGGYVLTIPRLSAALLAVHLRSGALSGPATSARY